jgi:signal transduction histidine kinase
VRDVQTIVQPLLDKNGNRLVVVCPDDIGSMRADLTKVRQTLFNLLSNAAKLTDHGVIELRVASCEDRGAQIEDAISPPPAPTARAPPSWCACRSKRDWLVGPADLQ